METKIIFRGIEYSDVEDMPPDVRSAYEEFASLLGDADRDGIPDMLQGQDDSIVRIERNSRIFLNGKEYQNIDDLPQEIRETLEHAKRHPGEAQVSILAGPATELEFLQTHSRSPARRASSVVEEVRGFSARDLFLLGGGILLGLVLAGAAAAVLLR